MSSARERAFQTVSQFFLSKYPGLGPLERERMLADLVGKMLEEEQETLRDRMAMAALPLWPDREPATTAKLAYMIADAMLEARRRPEAAKQEKTVPFDRSRIDAFGPGGGHSG